MYSPIAADESSSIQYPFMSSLVIPGRVSLGDVTVSHSHESSKDYGKHHSHSNGSDIGDDKLEQRTAVLWLTKCCSLLRGLTNQEMLRHHVIDGVLDPTVEKKMKAKLRKVGQSHREKQGHEGVQSSTWKETVGYGEQTSTTTDIDINIDTQTPSLFRVGLQCLEHFLLKSHQTMDPDLFSLVCELLQLLLLPSLAFCHDASGVRRVMGPIIEKLLEYVRRNGNGY